jgi:hypothetical protein
MIQTYKEKASGQPTKLEVSHMDTSLVVFKRQGRAMETMGRAEFDKLFELQLPAVDPKTIPTVQLAPSSDAVDPLGPPIPANVVPDVDPAVKLIRALHSELMHVEDRLIGIGAKVDAIYKVIAAPAGDAPTRVIEPKKTEE